MKFNFNFIKDISLVRLAGIEKFILIDIHSGYAKFILISRRERFYKIKNNSITGYYETVCVHQHYLHNDLNTIKNAISELIKKHDFPDAAIVIGINDFKFSTISVPADTEDVDLWFIENSSKFLPEGRPPDEFAFSYVKYREDENNKYFYIVIARNDFVLSISKACQVEGIKIIGLFPFLLSAFTLEEYQNKNLLALAFEEDKIIYAFRNEAGNVLYRDMFFDIYGTEQDGKDLSLEERTINIDNLNFCLEELKQTLSLTYGEQSLERLNIAICSHKMHSEVLVSQIKILFKPEEINKVFSDVDPFCLSAMFAYNNILNALDSGINLLENEIKEKERSLLEKQVNLKIILSSGLVILFLLLSSYILESYLSNKMEADEESLLEVNAKTLQIEKLKDENKFLKANLAMLNKLKGKRVKNSNLLSDISIVMNTGSCLTDLKLDENKSSGFTGIDLTGLAYSQQDVAEVISKMEYSKKFKDISLVYSSSLNQGDLYMSSGLANKDYIKFNITAKYYAD